jgi:hypothetical protein
VDTFAGRGPSNSMLMQAVPHPTIPGACLLLLGSAGGGLGVLELQGKDEPALLLQGRTPDGASVIGLGLHKVSVVGLQQQQPASTMVACGACYLKPVLIAFADSSSSSRTRRRTTRRRSRRSFHPCFTQLGQLWAGLCCTCSQPVHAHMQSAHKRVC